MGWILEKTVASVKKLLSPGEETGEFSAGYLPALIRRKTFEMFSDADEKKQKLHLDVGCGEGLVVDGLLRRTEMDIIGIDIKKSNLIRSIARTGYTRRYSWVIADAFKLPFRNETFDSVTLLNLLINLPSENDAASVIREVSRVLKDGGRLVLDFRNGRNLLNTLRYRFVSHYDPGLNCPLVCHRLEKIVEWLLASSLVLEELCPVPSWMNVLLAPAIVVAGRKRCKKNG